MDEEFLEDLKTKIKSEFLPVSADAEVNIDELKEKIYEKLRFIRIYMRQRVEKQITKSHLLLEKILQF